MVIVMAEGYSYLSVICRFSNYLLVGTRDVLAKGYEHKNLHQLRRHSR